MPSGLIYPKKVLVNNIPSGLALDHRYTLEDYNFKGPDITFNRASLGTYFDNIGVLRTASSNILRRDHIFQNNQWIPVGLLIESSGTNLLVRSQEITHVDWFPNACSKTGSQIDPANGLTAVLITCNDQSNRHFILAPNIDKTSGTVYTDSIFVKPVGTNMVQLTPSINHLTTSLRVNFLLEGEGSITAESSGIVGKIQRFGEWYRISATYTANTTALNSGLIVGFLNSTIQGRLGAFVGNPSDSFMIAFGQVEASSFVSSYIATTTTSANRSQDFVSIIGGNRTNSISNNSGVGAITGTPGTLPTNWGETLFIPAGVSQTVVGTGIEDGIDYVDIRFAGTPSDSGGITIQLDSTTSIVASSGQTWTFSSYLKLVGGSWSGVGEINMIHREGTSDGTFVSQTLTLLPTIGSNLLSQQRYISTKTLSGGGSVARLTPRISFAHSTTPLNFTIRIGLPQMETGSTATSPIKTSGSSITLSSVIDSFYNKTEGVWFVEFIAKKPGTQFVILSHSGSNANRLGILAIPDGSIQARISNNSVETYSSSTPIIDIFSQTKSALAYKSGNSILVANGSFAASGVNSIVSNNINSVFIGRGFSGPFSFDGYIKSIKYYNIRKPNSFLQEITS
jgi:hypothetical protein